MALFVKCVYSRKKQCVQLQTSVKHSSMIKLMFNVIRLVLLIYWNSLTDLFWFCYISHIKFLEKF